MVKRALVAVPWIEPPDTAGLTVVGAQQIASTLNTLLADIFAVYLKTRNFHWHVSGPHFHDYHQLLGAQSRALLGITDDIAERVRKLGEPTLRSIGQIARTQRIIDNEASYVGAPDMLREIREDNLYLTAEMRDARGICAMHGDMASANLLERWIDATERHSWFLFETISSRGGVC